MSEISLEVAALLAASKFLDAHKNVVCSEPMPVFRFIKHALEHVDNLLEKELRADSISLDKV